MAPEEKSVWGAFGGGYKNGGLTEEAMELIDPIFCFDYMGSAQFEFGAIPEAMMKIGNHYEKNEIVVSTLALKKEVGYICSKEHEDEVVKRIKHLGRYGDSTPKLRTRDPTFFKNVFDGKEGFEKYRGWLEIDNGYMFFLDRDMFEKTDAMFKSFTE